MPSESEIATDSQAFAARGSREGTITQPARDPFQASGLRAIRGALADPAFGREQLSPALDAILAGTGFSAGTIRLLSDDGAEPPTIAFAGIDARSAAELSAREPAPDTWWEQLGYRKLISIPLRARGHGQGSITLASREKGIISPEQGELLYLLADQLSLALAVNDLKAEVSQHRAAREAALSHQNRFQRLLESAPDGIVIVDVWGRIQLTNREADRMFGYSNGELTGCAVETLIPNRLRGNHVQHRGDYLAAPRTRPMGTGQELLGLRKDGSEFPVEISLSPTEASGQLIISVVRDITDRMRVERERAALLASEQRKTEQLQLSIREAHHRIKNNLQAVSDLIYLELLQAGGADQVGTDALQGSMDRIQAIALVHDFLSKDSDVRLVEMVAVLERLVPMALASNGIDPAHIHLVLSLPQVALSSKRATAVALIVNELVANSAKYALRPGSGDTLTVTVSQEGEELVLQVRDNGPGLAPGFSLAADTHVGLDVVRILAERDLDGRFSLVNDGGVLAEVRFAW